MQEQVCGVYDVYFHWQDGYFHWQDGYEFWHYDRVCVIAENEELAAEKAATLQYMPYGVNEVVYRGEA